jgi:2',3'-cyclic-nucleotide 2'-phosphodiesterase (5'-nucleotidase family)
MFFIRIVAVLGLFAAFSHASAHAAQITFLLVNDIYQMSEEKMADGKARGGFARLAAVVKSEHAKGHPVILAHGGDTLSPSLMSGLDHGAHIVTLTNMIAPDIFAPGNHEFDFGKEVFLRRLAEAKFPVYAANLRGPDGHPLPGVRDQAIVERDGVRVGLTGAAFDDSARLSNPEDLRFQPTVETITERAAALRRDGADIVVAVMHATRSDAERLVATRAADIVLTGHSHDLVVAYDGRTALAESSHDAHYVVAIDVDIRVTESQGHRQVVWWPNFRIIDTANVVPDPAVAAAVAGFEAELTREMDVTLATIAVTLDSRVATVRGGEAAIGDLIADALRASTGADVAIVNGGGIRAGRVYEPGTAITRRDVLAELPFGNRMIRLAVTGRALRAALENGLSALPQIAGRFPQVSGLVIAADMTRPPGQRITSIAVGGAPLDDDRTYSVATNDFLARGGDGYSQFRDAPRIVPDDDAPPIANEVMVHLRRLGTVRVENGGRIILK